MATANAARFDGSNDALTKASDYTAIADSKQWTASLWYKPGTTATNMQLIHGVGAAYRITHEADDEIRFSAENAAGSTIFSEDTNTLFTNTSKWYHLLMSGDLAVPISHVYVDDADDEKTGGTNTDDTMNFTAGAHGVGSTSGAAGKLNGSLSEVWIDFGNYLDLTVEANRRKFITSGLKAVDLGSDGSKPTLSAPILYLSNPFGTFEQNNGTGGDLSVTGELADATGPELATVAGLPPALFHHAQRRSTLLRM